MIKTDSLSPKEHAIVFEEIEYGLLSSSFAREKKEIFILGGQPGSGKSSATEYIKKKLMLDDGVAVINGDDYRASHPRLKEIVKDNDKMLASRTDPDVRKWTSEILDSAIRNGRSVIFESTLRSAHPIAETIQTLHEHGYAVSIAVMAVPRELSAAGILLRYESQKESLGYGRWSSPQYHDIAYDALPKTMRELESTCPLERMLVFSREGELIYDNERKDGVFSVPHGGKDGAAALEAYRNRPLTLEQRALRDRSAKMIFELMRKRGTLEEEVSEVRQFLRSVDRRKIGRSL